MRSPTRGWVNATLHRGLFAVALIAMLGTLLPAGPANARRGRKTSPRAQISAAHGFAIAVLRAQNAQRRSNGLPLLGNAGALDRAARQHVHDMVRRRYFGHVSPTGSDPLHRALGAGYRGRRTICVGENILSWPTGLTAGQVVQKFMESPPHRENILGHWTDVGVAVVRHSTSGGRGLTVAVEFGRRG